MTQLHNYQPGLGENGTPGSSTGLRYAHSDPLGTLRSHTDASCAAYASFAYTAFGERVDGGAFQRHGYAGAWGYQAGDFPSGNPAAFLHVGMRWYDPAIGRFLQRDPIGIADDLNVYAYVFGMPTAGVDPTGNGFMDGDNPVHDWVARQMMKIPWFKDRLADMSDGEMYAWGIGGSVVGGCGIYFGGPYVVREGFRTFGRGIKLGVHSPHHGMGYHVQLNWWRIGVKGSHGAMRWPIPSWLGKPLW
ncbi:MAG: RHS repeat-associated core domain-containing protein [Planctomycetia bacterium]|nr:RHS repeat-associated core domain-containing protein [Planctomycetia bacterium]